MLFDELAAGLKWKARSETQCSEDLKRKAGTLAEIFSAADGPKDLFLLKFMVQKKNSQLDIINEVLEECILAYPVSSFVISIYKQYQQRGSLSKKQLLGLFGKAGEIENLPAGKLATLEAVIKKMPNRFKSELPETKPMFEKDALAGEMIDAILAKYPQHKRVVFFKAKYDNNETLSPVEVDELKKFKQILKV